MVIDRSSRAVGWLFILIALLAGCAQGSRSRLPPTYSTSARFLDLNAPPQAQQGVDRDVVQEVLARFQTEGKEGSRPYPSRQYRILALSGGGANGAFSVGLLNGWSAAGTRPQFDIVTGISTGGLIATYSFLGPAYDRQLCEMYTSVSSADIYRKRPIGSLLWADSAATCAPLKRMIDARIDCGVMQSVALAHAQGRRLYIGTTHLERQRLVIWDMGAIASSGRPDALDLYRKIVLASASVPGFFPPVPIEVQINGQPFTETHVDGATTSEVFLRSTMLPIDLAAVQAGQLPLAGSDVYIIKASKFYADPACVKPRLPGIAGSALSALMAAHGRNDVVRIWTLSLLTGMRFHLAVIPQDYPLSSESMTFDPGKMRQLYELGYELACSGRAWRKTPPGLEPSEQNLPRSGTEFVGPAAIDRAPSSPEPPVAGPIR